uniref:Uncharacterized protein n=1 Tax=Oryza sativa subsp. indica TaxID=39946 RepID=A0A679BBL7_ORYSI|nr:hypothetical protein [Oryza sativa Indica Group]
MTMTVVMTVATMTVLTATMTMLTATMMVVTGGRRRFKRPHTKIRIFADTSF